MEYHLPVQKAMLDVSFLNSLVRASEMISLYVNLWMAAADIMPIRAFEKTNPSKRNMISKDTMSMITAMAWAMAARTEPNFLQHILKIGPIQQAIPKNIAHTPALTAIGAKATIPTRIKEDVLAVAVPLLFDARTPV